MADKKISFAMRGVEPLKQYLDVVKRHLRGYVTKETANILAVEYLRPYPDYKYASRKMAYGKTFFTKKQRSFVMAAIAAGTITPGRVNRKGKLFDAWKVTGAGAKAKISVNESKAKYAKYVVGDAQAAQPYHAGWIKAKYVIQENLAEATEKAQRKVDDWIKSGRPKP